MAEYTPNFNLKKPTEEEFYNVADQNDNMDKIDTALKTQADELATKETPTGAQSKADTAESNAKAYTDTKIGAIQVPVTSVNSKTGAVVLSASDVGAETPTGAQQKANTAENNAKAYTNTHINNKSNPHGVTKAQVGLGSVQNYGIATQAEAEAGASNSKYMTPLRVKEAMPEVKFSIFTGRIEIDRETYGTLTVPLGKNPSNYVKLSIAPGDDHYVGDIFIDIKNEKIHGRSYYYYASSNPGLKGNAVVDIPLGERVENIRLEAFGYDVNDRRFTKIAINGNNLLLEYFAERISTTVVINNLFVEVL